MRSGQTPCEALRQGMNFDTTLLIMPRIAGPGSGALRDLPIAPMLMRSAFR